MPTGPIIKEGFPLIGVMLFITIIAVYFGYYSIAIITFILALFFVNFFRNPKRNIPTDPDAILSPADGKVMEIEDVYEDLYLHRECKKVTIFLSVFDVHANRAPIEGKITYRHYTMGSFLPAFKEDVGFENERHTICIENDKTEVLVKQIAGLLARRIVSWTDLDSVLKRGQLYGMIKFGSCTEIYMDKNVEICIEKGQHITGGDTIIGRLRHE